MCVLLVDDDPDYLLMLKTMLERDSHEVLTASSGKEALTIAKDASFDLVITDIIMPEVEGIELIQQIKKLHPSMNCIAISGGGHFGSVPYLKAAEKLGAFQTLSKPFSREELRKAIDMATQA